MITTILIFIIVLSILVFVHEFGHFLVAKKSGMLVEEFGLGIPPRIFGKKIGETIYSINWLPIGGFVRIYGEEEEALKKNSTLSLKLNRAFAHKPWYSRALVIIAGPFMNALLAVVLLSIVFTLGTYIPQKNVRVESVAKFSPAFKAGISKDDIVELIKIGNKTFVIDSTDKLSRITQKYAGKQILMQVRTKSEKTSIIKIVPRANPPKGQGALGITISQFVFIKVPWYKAPIKGMQTAYNMSKEFYSELGKVVLRLSEGKKPGVEIAGPVGIAKITGSAARSGITVLTLFTALFSLNLALINLLPFPALDGGQLMFIVYEAVVGKPVNALLKMRINAIGFALLLALLLLVTIKDVRTMFFGR